MTILYFLSDVELGGETAFPMAGQKNATNNEIVDKVGLVLQDITTGNFLACYNNVTNDLLIIKVRLFYIFLLTCECSIK